MSRRRCAWLWFFSVYTPTIVDYQPVCIANAKLRARTISRKPLYVCVRTCVHVNRCIHVCGAETGSFAMIINKLTLITNS